MAIEEPAFEVIHTTSDYEIRRYEPFIVAEVDVGGDMSKAGNRAFQMTSPVVSHEPAGDRDTYTYAFVMESRYSLESLPAPVDPRIRIVQKPGRIIAARAYSGRWTEDNYRENEVVLVSKLAIDGLQTEGNPYLARYDSPMKPWFMRRNEVLVELDWE